MKEIEVVAGVIKNNKNQYLCAQRKDYGELALKWEFPGGKLEQGETNKIALIRELKEELDIDVIVYDLLITVNHTYKTFRLKMHAYECQILDGALSLNEHIAYKWLPLDELKSLDWAEADNTIINKLLKQELI